MHQSGILQNKTSIFYFLMDLFQYFFLEPPVLTWARVKVKRHVWEAPAPTWRLEVERSPCWFRATHINMRRWLEREPASCCCHLISDGVKWQREHSGAPPPGERCFTAPQPDLGCTSHGILGGRITGRARFSRQQHEEQQQLNLQE